MDNNIFDLYAKRHSFYNITNDCPLTAEEIENLVQKSLELYPSPFNSQSARVMVLFGKNHKNLWSITQTELLKAAPKEKAQQFRIKLQALLTGTELFYILQILQLPKHYRINFRFMLQILIIGLISAMLFCNLWCGPLWPIPILAPTCNIIILLLMMLFVKLLTYQTIGNLLPKCLLAALVQLLKHTVLKI